MSVAAVTLAGAFAAASDAKSLIVYTARSGGGDAVFEVSPNGRHPHKVADGFSGTISRDGKRLAFIAAHGIAVADAEGRHVRYVSRQIRDVSALVLSPNGRELAIYKQSDASSVGRLYVARLPHGRLRQVYRNEGEVRDTSITWSPDSRRFALNADPARRVTSVGGAPETTADVVVVDVARGSATPVTQNVTDSEGCTPGAAQTNLNYPVWGPHGLAVLGTPFSCSTSDGGWAPETRSYSLALMDPNGQQVRTLVAKLPQELAYAQWGAWSPDGRDLLLTAGPVHHSGEIGRIDELTAGGALHRLGNVAALTFAPISWSR